VEWPKLSELVYHDCVHVYRCMQLFTQLLNKAYGSIFLPCSKLVMIFVTLLSVFSIIRLRAVLTPILYACFIFYFISAALLIPPGAILTSVVYNLASQFHRHVQENLRVNRAQGTLTKKELVALPLLKCTVGNFYYMEERAKLTLIQLLTVS